MKPMKKLLALNLAFLLLMTVLSPVAAAAGAALKLGETATGSQDVEYTFIPAEDGEYRIIFENSTDNLPGGSTSASLNLWGKGLGSGNDGSWGYDRIHSLDKGTAYTIKVQSTDWIHAGAYTLKIIQHEEEKAEPPADYVITEIPTAAYSERRSFSEGLAAVYGKSSVKGEGARSTSGWGFIDKTGTEVIPCQYEEAQDFSEGLAAVRLGNGKWGFIDKTGVEVISGKYDDVNGFHEGLAAVVQEGRLGFIDKVGNEVVPCIYREFWRGYGEHNFSEGLAAVQDAETYLWGFVDKAGKEIVSCRYKSVRDFSDGLAAVSVTEKDKNGIDREKWGYIDQTGREIISCQYSSATKFSNGYAVVSKHTVDMGGDNIYDYIVDKAGKTQHIGTLVSTIMLYGASSYGDFEGGPLLVRTGDGYVSSSVYTYMDMNGNSARFENYLEARKFSDGMAAVCSQNWGFINTEGKEVLPNRYGEVGDFHEGFAWVETLNGCGYVDKNGREVVSCGYDAAGDFSDGAAWVRRDDEYMLLLIGDGSEISAGPIPSTGTAYASTQTVAVDGKAVLFECYALKDTNGNPTNYIKLRDVALALNGTRARFEVGWDKNGVKVTTGQPYTPNGSEMSTPFSGDRSYEVPTAKTWVNGAVADLQAIVLTDDRGGQYTYYKLRDLGAALGFLVEWSPQNGIYIETE